MKEKDYYALRDDLQTLIKYRPRDMHIEELNERAHEEGGDDRSDARDRGDGGDFAAGQKEQADAEYYAYQIGDDPDVLELAFLPGVADDQRDGVIGGDAQVRRHVEGRAEAYDDDADHKAEHPDGHRRGDDHFLQEFISELGDIA